MVFDQAQFAFCDLEDDFDVVSAWDCLNFDQGSDSIISYFCNLVLIKSNSSINFSLSADKF